jgi:hypothetical protein
VRGGDRVVWTVVVELEKGILRHLNSCDSECGSRSSGSSSGSGSGSSSSSGSSSNRTRKCGQRLQIVWGLLNAREHF